MATIKTGLIHSIIPAYQAALQDLATHESRIFLVDLLHQASWTQGFAEHKEEAMPEAYKHLIDLIQQATAAPTIEACLQALVGVGECLDQHFAEAVRLAASKQSSVVDPDALMSTFQLFE